MSEPTIHPASAELEEQLRRLETIADPASRSIATDLLASVLQFHTAALERMIEIIGAHEDAPNTLQGFGRDPLIASMLLIHNLHPDSIEARVRRTITDLEASARKHDATIELISAEEALVKVHIRGGQPGRPFGPIVEQALRNGVPDAAHIIVEEPAAAGPSFVPLEALQKAPLAEATVLTEK